METNCQCVTVQHPQRFLLHRRKLAGTAFRLFCNVVFAVSIGACGGGGGGTGPANDANPASPTSQAPSVASQPTDATVAQGQAASFSATAAGSAPLAYQWLRNGSPIAGATSPTLALSAVQLTDSGAQFSVTVSNSAGTTTSATVTLKVTPATMAVSASSSSLPSFGAFTLTNGGGFAPPTSELQPVAYAYALEYTLAPTAVFSVPARVESDGTIHAYAPPGAIANQAFASGPVGLRVKRTLTASPTATPVVDYSNSITLNVALPSSAPVPAGYATALLALVGKYSATHAASYDNTFLDAATASSLNAYDYDGNIAAAIGHMSAQSLAISDQMAQAVLLSVFNYDLSAHPVAHATMPISTALLSLNQRKAGILAFDVTDAGIQAVAQSIAASARSVGGTMADIGKVVGLGAAAAAIVVESPVLLAVAGTGALMTYVGTISGTALGFAFDSAAEAANPSSTPQSRFKSVLEDLNFFASNTMSSTIDAVFNPFDGYANEYMMQNLSPVAYQAYTEAAGFLTAESGPFSEKIMSTAEALAAADPTTPAADSAQLAAASQTVAPRLVSSALDASTIQQVSAGASSSDLDALSNAVAALFNTVQVLQAIPGAQQAFNAPMNTFSACLQSPLLDLQAVLTALPASGASDAQVAQIEGDVRSVLACGSTLLSSLNGISPSATSQPVAASSGDYVDSAANCSSSGCWITEETSHADGTTSTRTGFRACGVDGYCPLDLD